MAEVADSQKCPNCGLIADGTYHWRLTYEFLVGGTEDEEYLDRITDEAAEALRARLGGSPS